MLQLLSVLKSSSQVLQSGVSRSDGSLRYVTCPRRLVISALSYLLALLRVSLSLEKGSYEFLGIVFQRLNFFS